jgi:acetoin utilization deacetylase AcuC-like enzyme
MRTYYSDAHLGHAGLVEFSYGELLPCFELPVRAQTVLARVQSSGLGEVREPEDLGRAAIERVHLPDYVAFLEHAWDLWAARGRSQPALPMVWRAGPAVPSTQPASRPTHIDGLLGYWSQDCATSMVAGSWRAIERSAQCALNAARDVADGAGAAFALCRPPGHHALADAMGGFCFLNNAAITAQWLRDRGAARVAVLDIDYHHGNGTQQIFYARDDVFYASLHADPAVDYPFYAGYAHERGAGAGEGWNLNLPLPHGTGWDTYADTLDHACDALAAARCDACVVSLGVDTFERDPISRFALASPHYLRIGERIARLTLPVVFVLEGGYATDELGENVVNVLAGFAHATRR